VWYVELGIPPPRDLFGKNNKAINGHLSMKSPKSPLHRRQSDRRSHLDRRWIKSHYQGEERRSGNDRRSEIEFKNLDINLPVSEDSDSKKFVGLERLLVSNTVQLEAVTRLLLEKGILDENELLSMMKTVQSEYHTDQQSE
jgi:hypothetical protein